MSVEQELSNLTTERNRLNLELANTQSISAINNITNRIKQQGLEASNQRLTGKVQDLSNQVQSYQKELLNRVTQLDGWKYLSTDKQTEIIRKINEGDPTYDPTKEITVPVSGEELSKAFGKGETLSYVKDVMSQTYQQHPGMVISGTVLGTLLLAYGGYKAYKMWKNYRERKRAEASVTSE